MDLTTTTRLLARVGMTGALALALIGGAGAQAQSAATIATSAAPSLGTFLTDQTGRTLYIYTRDEVGISHCYESCADRKSTRLNSSHEWISYAVFCLKKKNAT